MKNYLLLIQKFQKFLIDISVIFLLVFPIVYSFFPETVSGDMTQQLFDISYFALFFVMMIRPLADIFRSNKWVRLLVQLRKGLGILSASVIVAFIFSKIIIGPAEYFSSILTIPYWSLHNFALFAHLGDISAILLLATSNVFSKRVLGPWWKRVQRLSYVYFYSSSLFIFLAYSDISTFFAMVAVTTATLLAYIVNRDMRLSALPLHT